MKKCIEKNIFIFNMLTKLFLAICEEGMFALKEKCQTCDVGKTTLSKGAISDHFCIGK